MAKEPGNSRLSLTPGPLVEDSIFGPGDANATPVTAVGTWSLVSHTFIVQDADTYRLSFGAAGQEETLGGFIDSVSIHAVPLPAAAWLFGSALLGLVGLGRRKVS